MIIRFTSKVKLHASNYDWLTRRSGVWIAVLLIHFFLWIVLNQGRDISPSPPNMSTYISVIPITLNDSSVPAQQLVENGQKDISEKVFIPSRKNERGQRTDRDMGASEKKTITPELLINKKGLTELLNSKEISALQESASQSTDKGYSKQTKTLNYDEMKAAALSITHESRHRLLPGADEKLTNMQKFADAIDHAKRGDCRSEHAHLGILAIPFLLKDTITDEGCKW